MRREGKSRKKLVKREGKRCRKNGERHQGRNNKGIGSRCARVKQGVVELLKKIEHGDDKAVTTKNRFEALGEKFLGSLEEEKTVIVGGGRAGRRNKIGRRTKNSKGPNHCSKRGQNQGRKRKKILQKTLIVIEIPGQAKSS